MTTTFIVILITLLFSAFFSGMEIAYVSSNKIFIEIETNKGGLISHILRKMTRKPSKFITTMLLGNNIALVIYGMFMGDLLVQILTPDHPLQSNFLNYWLAGSGSIITQTLISTLLILVTAEFLPKVFFQVYSNKFLKIFAIPSYLFYQLFNFLSSFVMWISDMILKLFFKTEGDEVQEAFTKMELGNFITEQLETVEEEEVDSEVKIFKNALEFSDIKIREVMIPRPEIVAVEVEENLSELRKKFIETGLSKILVYQGDNDNIIGYVHSFELFKKPTSIKSIILPTFYIPETTLAKDVLNTLIKKRMSIAIVIDEYGGTSGMVTLEDIVEELFGEIEDEHDAALLVEEDLGDGQFKLSGRLEIDYLNDKYHLDLPESESYETLSGLIIHFTEEIPEKDHYIEIAPYRLSVLKVSKTRVELVALKTIDKRN